MNELGIVIILLVCGAAIAGTAIVVAKLATKNEKKLADELREAELEAAFDQDVEPAKYHYRAEGRVMSAQQEDFYMKLAGIFGERCYIFPNVAMVALVDAEISGQDEKMAMRKIAGQTVDYVMCRADNFKILCTVVLADDQRVAILRGAGVPVAVMRDPLQMEKQQIVDQIAAAVRTKR